MNIETHFITWNRADCIHMTVNHYLKLGKVIVHDNFSTDNTREICESLGAEVRLFGVAGVLDDGEYLKVKNEVWKSSKADWVIIVDDDEILWHPSIIQELQYAKDSGATIVRPQGLSMFSKTMPIDDWTEVMTGYKDDKYSKLCCFNPQVIEEINYVYGCHEAHPKGRIRCVDKLYLLHYMGVGGVERMIDRHALYEPRRQQSRVNMRWALGTEYGFTAESKREWYEKQLAKSRNLDLW